MNQLIDQMGATEALDDEIENDPEFLEWYARFIDLFWLADPGVKDNLDLKRYLFLAWDAGFDTGYKFSEDIQKALKGIDLRTGAISI